MIKRGKYRKRRKPISDKNQSRQSQYEDVRWKEFAYKIFVRDGFKCQQKGCKGGCTELHAHHRKYAINKKIWEVPTSWVISVCADCHSRIHHRDLHKTRRKRKPPTKSGV